MAYDLARLEQGLINADKAGDVDAARTFAAEIRKMRAQSAPAAPAAPENTLQVFNPATLWNDQAQNFDTGIPLGENTQNALSGAGKAFADIGRRVGQMTGQVSASDIDAAKKLDAPLMATKAGVAGNLIGNAAAFAPTALVPGANTVTGAGLTGALMGAMQPTGTDDSTLKNMALGAATGAGTQWGLNKAASVLGARLSRKAAEATSEQTRNAARDATIEAGQKLGLTVPRSEYNPSVVSNILEKWGGKAATGQQASLNNQQVVNRVARETLGLSDNTPITPEALMPVKKAAWSVYDQLRGLGDIPADSQLKTAIADIAKKSTNLNPVPGIDDLAERLNQGAFNADDLVTAIQDLRANASTRLKPMNFDVGARNLGKAEVRAADALEGLLERHLQGTAGGDLVSRFRQARVTLGKVGTIERAMNEATGNVNANKLIKDLDKGKLTGDLRDVALFAKGFNGKYTQPNVNPIPGGSPLDVALASAGAGSGSPGLASTAIGYATGRPLARRLALSSLLAKRPDYSVGMTTRLAPMLAGNESVQTLARLLASAKASQQ